MNAIRKSINKTLNTSFLVLILLVLNLAIQTTFQKTYFKKENKSLKTKITVKGDKENGSWCDTNSQCKSGYCGYNGPMLNEKPKNYDNYACMEKYSKPYNTPCWHDRECRLHQGLYKWSNCKKYFSLNTNKNEYTCE